MKARFIQIAVFCTVTVMLISTVFYFLLCHGLRNVKQDSVGKFNYIVRDSTYYNTVFLGSSTLHVGIDALQFDSLTGRNSFNAGMDGMEIAEEHMMIRKYVAAHGLPTDLYLNLDELSLSMQRAVWYFPQYYPFIDDPDMQEIVRLEPKLLLGRYFPPAAVTYFDDALKSLGLIGLLKGRNGSSYVIPHKGYVPKAPRQMEDFKSTEAFFESIDRGWQLLEESLKLCRAKGIKVHILLMPRYNYSISASSKPYMQKLKAIAEEYGAVLQDYTTDKRFSDKDLFFDRIHLNRNGASLFTSILSEELTKEE